MIHTSIHPCRAGRASLGSFAPHLLAICLSALTAAAVQAQTGGGWLHAGLRGEYFANTALAGAPVFSRRDVRLDFDWGALRAPGGSPAPGFLDVAADNFSARWTGQLSARFSETYTLIAEVGGDEAVKWEIKPEGAGDYTTLFDHAGGGSASNTFALAAGARYDVRVEYREFTGAARLSLRWSSPSTPEEIIDSATTAAVNMDTYASQLWANLMDNGRDEWGPVNYGGGLAPARDADGWPLGDGTNIPWEGSRGPERAGTYLLQFNGRAQVTTAFGYGTFAVGASNHGFTLPFGAGYDAGRNTTTAFVNVSSNAGILYLTLTQTRRQPADTSATGVSAVKLMAPLAPGGTNHHPVGSYFAEPLKAALGRYTALRWILNFDTDRNWLDRVRPSRSSHAQIGRERYWEQMVMLANETGKDLYLCLPVRATDDYLARVAQLVRFGSDGVDPYTSDQANPLFPPLNSNLRAIVERENEIWNFAFSNFGNNVADVVAAAGANAADWQAVNYDGAFTGRPQDAWRRWHALRTVRASQIFRGIWGDAAMGRRVRVLYEYQYDNLNGTAQGGLSFLDNYFNNADGAHIPDPHPVNYHLWGAGAAVYYGSGNAQGAQTNFALANAGLETPALSPGEARANPAAASWNFAGTAGLYLAPDKRPAWTNAPAGAAANTLVQPQSLGCRFTVGPAPVAVVSLGHWVAPGNSRAHTLRLLRASDRNELANIDVNLGGASSGQYLFADFGRPLTLAPNTTYYLVSSEEAGADTYFAGVPITPDLGITIDGTASATYGDPAWDTSRWTVSEPQAGAFTFGPVNLRFIAAPVGGLGYPPDPPEGTQAAWIAGTGEMSQTLLFPQAGTFALRMQAAAKENAENSVRFYFDDVAITPDGSYHGGARARQWAPGEGFAREYRRYENNTTYVFDVPAPGTHTLRIAGLGLGRYEEPFTPPDTNRYIYFDQLEIVSADALFAGGIPGAGEANGQVASANYVGQLNSQARYAQAYGLQIVAYEGGWSLGGDFGATAFQNWCKHRDSRAKRAQLDSINTFARSGGALYTFGTYETWPASETIASTNFPLAQAVDEFNAALPPEPRNGLALPAVLTAGTRTWSINNSGATLNGAGGWMHWNVLSSGTASYQLSVITTPGGSAILESDGTPVSAGFASGGTNSFNITLTKGLHALKVRSAGGTFAVTSVTASQTGAPNSPTLASAAEADARVALGWTPPANGPAVASYVVRYGTASGQYDFDLEAGTATNATVTGLADGILYYFAVIARNTAGLSLPSNERTAAPVGPSQATRLAAWEFTGLSGVEGVDISHPPYAASGNAVLSVLTRGPGLSVGYNQFSANTFASGAAPSQGANYGLNFTEAKSRMQYYTFMAAPAAGRRLSLMSLEFRPYFQAALGTLGAAVTWSANGATFFDAPAASGTPVPGVGNGALHAVDLSAVAALQHTASNITLRVYLWGAIRFGSTGLGGSGDDLLLRGFYELPLPSLLTAGFDAAQRTFHLRFPTQPGQSYTVLESSNLTIWTPLSHWSGTGAEAELNFPATAPTAARFFQLRSP